MKSRTIFTEVYRVGK